MEHFFKEIADVFPDNTIHLGGDEVDFGCWYVRSFSTTLSIIRQSNPEIREFMNRTGFNDSYYKLENYYISNLLERIHSGINREMKTHVWQEVFDNKV